MAASSGLIAGRADTARIEQVPLAARSLAHSTYELLWRAAAEHGEREALVFVPKGSAEEPPFACSYAELLRRVTQAANLFHRLGIGAGDVVAYALPSLPQTHFALYGAEAAGIACAINPLLEAKHVVEILRAAGAKVLVTLGPGPGGELWEKMAAVVEQVPTLETVLQVRLAQYLVPGHVARAPVEQAHAGRRVLDFDAECAREPGDRPVSCSKRRNTSGGIGAAPQMA
jgi:fatty-acyl-CoA synthase